MIKRFRKFLDGRLKERTKRESSSVVEVNVPIERYLSFAQKIRDIRVNGLDTERRFRDVIASSMDMKKMTKETRKDVVAIATRLLTTRQFSVVDSLILLIRGLSSTLNTTQELCEDPRFSRALFVFALEEMTSSKRTNFLKLISILAKDQSYRVSRLIDGTDGMLQSLILSTSKCHSEAYVVFERENITFNTQTPHFQHSNTNARTQVQHFKCD